MQRQVFRWDQPDQPELSDLYRLAKLDGILVDSPCSATHLKAWLAILGDEEPGRQGAMHRFKSVPLFLSEPLVPIHAFIKGSQQRRSGLSSGFSGRKSRL
jgi:hypothetical protein